MRASSTTWPIGQDNLKEIGKPEFAVVVHRSWRDDPGARLLARVQDSVERPSGDDSTPCRRGRRSPMPWRSGRTLDGTLLIILDQFEEFSSTTPAMTTPGPSPPSSPPRSTDPTSASTCPLPPRGRPGEA